MYITLRQYADREKISVPSARKRVERGKVKCKREKGRIYVEVEGADPPVAAEESRSALEDRWSVENELKLAKVQNLKADILLKREKFAYVKEKYRLEFCEGVLEAFATSFSPLKSCLVGLRLDKEALSKFRAVFGRCLKKFKAGLGDYLAAKDKEEEEE